MDLAPKLLGMEFQPNLCVHLVAPVSPLGLPDSPPLSSLADSPVCKPLSFVFLLNQSHLDTPSPRESNASPPPPLRILSLLSKGPASGT